MKQALDTTTLLTARANWKVAAAFFLDGSTGLAIDLHAASKIMAGTENAEKNNCSCSQYGYWKEVWQPKRKGLEK